MKTVFVTGINGLLGTNLVKLLLNNGYQVKGLVRCVDSYKGGEHKNLNLITGTLFDDFTGILKNTDYVVHIAAVTSQNILSQSYYWNVNTNSTKQLYQAACLSRIKKFIYVSTANTIGFGSLQKPGEEEDAMRSPFDESIYAVSKKSAESYVLSENKKMQTVVVNPTFMLGAYDTKPSSGKIILMVWKKKIVFYPPGGKNFVHVEDVANGILKAITIGANGYKYLLSNENLSFKNFFQKVNHNTSQNPLMIKLPKWILLPLGYVGDALRYMHVSTSLSSVNSRILCVNNFYSNKKSIEELGLNYQSIDKAICDSVDYFSKN